MTDATAPETPEAIHACLLDEARQIATGNDTGYYLARAHVRALLTEIARLEGELRLVTPPDRSEGLFIWDSDGNLVHIAPGEQGEITGSISSDTSRVRAVSDQELNRVNRPDSASAYVAGKLAEVERLATEAAERHKAELARRDRSESHLRWQADQLAGRLTALYGTLAREVRNHDRTKLWALCLGAAIIVLLIALIWSNAWRIVP